MMGVYATPPGMVSLFASLSFASFFNVCSRSFSSASAARICGVLGLMESMPWFLISATENRKEKRKKAAE